jgi:sugar phosphate isomerase/epimerase
VIRLGVDAICWHARLTRGEITLQQIIEDIASLDVACLQVDLNYVAAAGGPAVVADEAHGHGLELLASGGPVGRRHFDGSSARAIASVSESIVAARALGSSTLMVHSGVYRPDLAGDPAAIQEELRHLREVLVGAASFATEQGVTLLLENSSDFKASELMPLFEERPESVAPFLDVTNPYNVWDDPVEAIGQLGKYAVAGHVKDFVLSSIWNADEFHRYGYTVEFRYPGEGVADVPSLLRALDEAIDGRVFPLTIEGLDNHPGVDDQLPRLKRSVAFVDEVLGGLSTSAVA